MLRGIIYHITGGQEERNGQQHSERKRKKKDGHLFEIKITDRFGTLELPHNIPQVWHFILSRKLSCV